MISIEELRALRSKRRLTTGEKEAYLQYWQISNQSQRVFCKQEALSLSTFSSWIKLLSTKDIEEKSKEGYIAVEVNGHSVQPIPNLALQFKLPNGLVIEGCFSLNEVGCFIKELSNGLTPLR